MIPFNKPYLTGKEVHYIYKAVYDGKLSGNGQFTKMCQNYLEQRYGFKKCLLTTSGTDALEMCAMLCDLKPGDEVIIPSFTFVSTALAFLRQGAKVIFADSYENNPNIDADKIESLITERTKVIAPVHYAGVACDMGRIMEIANNHNLIVVEDAAQAIDSFYDGKPLGSIGHLAAFSFHETKNIIAGEGGMLTINDPRFIDRAEIIWEKGTNRASFFRGEINKYGWVDMGSSFLPSELSSAFLWAQLENIDSIQKRRKYIWNQYYDFLEPLANKGYFKLPDIPSFSTNNAHMFYLVFPNLKIRTAFIKYMKDHDILSVFHYLPLHSSPYYHTSDNKEKTNHFSHDGRQLPNCDRFSDCLVRLPMYYELSDENISYICANINNFISEYDASR